TGSRHGEETEKTQPAEHAPNVTDDPAAAVRTRPEAAQCQPVPRHGRRAASAARSFHTRYPVMRETWGRSRLHLLGGTCESLREMRLVLASTSPARRALLDGLGVAYVAEAPGVDEEVPPGTAVEDAVRMLALRKARAVAARHPDALVLGADQLAEVDGRVLGKPDSRDAARAQLGALLGRTHRLLTAVALVGGGDEQLELD